MPHRSLEREMSPSKQREMVNAEVSTVRQMHTRFPV